ncbi:MAG: class I SAM-dependent methyltransferase [Thermoplasmatales archaeon]
MPAVKCPLCESTNNELLLDLGRQPPANALSSTYESAVQAERFDLSIMLCNNCLYVWLKESLPPQKLFKNNTYITGVSTTTRKDMERFAKSCILNCTLPANSSVLDIGSNDGTLLSYFKNQGYSVVGVEPSEYASELAVQKGIPTIKNFFNEELSSKILREYGKFDLITATNVLTHVKDPSQFLESCKSILKEGGSIVVEFYYFESIISNLAFDQIYHEHISYFNMTTFVKLLDKVGLKSYHAETVASQGGSLRIFISFPGKHNADNSIVSLLSAEGSFSQIMERYKKFAISVKKRSREILDVLESKHKEGKLVAGYGASAKATVITNYLGIDANIIKTIADLSAIKQGKYLPGAAIPIISPEDLIDLSPDVIIIFSWNIAEEIVHQLSKLIRKDFNIITLMPRIEEKMISGGKVK